MEEKKGKLGGVVKGRVEGKKVKYRESDGCFYERKIKIKCGRNEN